MTNAEAPCSSILVVEDDVDVREAIVALLEDERYRVYAAGNGREALERLAVIERPCMILLDLMMPIMSGHEFLEAIREDDAIAPIPVVVVSAWPREAARAQGVRDFLKKPVDAEVLVRMVRRHCGPAPGEC